MTTTARLLAALYLVLLPFAVPDAGAQPPKRLSDIQNLVNNEGIWEGTFTVRGPDGEIRRSFKSLKKMQIWNDEFLQLNTYTYDDGKVEVFRFIGKLDAKGDVDFASPDRDYFERAKILYRSPNPQSATWIQVNRATGTTTGVEFISTIGKFRTATNHRYTWDANYTAPTGYDGVTTVREVRIGELPKAPIMVLTAEERARLVWR